MNKQTTIRAIAGKTGMTYHQVQTMLEALVETWSEALAGGEPIAIQDFLTLRVTELKTHRRGKLRHHADGTPMRQVAYRVDVRLGNALRKKLNPKLTTQTAVLTAPTAAAGASIPLPDPAGDRS
jgi:nucleoid DNA-binding protein